MGTEFRGGQVGVTRPGPHTQDLRVAVAMTGGVSLAVWIGGVVRELNLLQQASWLRWADGSDGQGGTAGVALMPPCWGWPGRVRVISEGCGTCGWTQERSKPY